MANWKMLAGYNLVVYAIDVSPSMGEKANDPGDGSSKTKLALAKEFVARQCEPKVSSGRKTEAVGIVSFGGATNNQANQAFVAENPDEDDPPYAAVSSDVAIQTAKPKTIEEVINLQPGEVEGNPVSALMVALDMVYTHKHTKAWALEIMLITDGESAFRQDEYEDCMQRFDEMGVKLSIVGIGFAPMEEVVDKTKTRNKRLSEKFWRTFYQMLHDRISPTTESEEILPSYYTFDDELLDARMPKPAKVNGTVSATELCIGSPEISPDQAIRIPVKYSKATMKARPPTLSKAWKPAIDLQSSKKGQPTQFGSSQLAQSVAQQSQQLDVPASQSDLAAMVSAEVKHYSSYVVKKQPPAPPNGTTPSQSEAGPSRINGEQSQLDAVPEEAGDEEDEAEEAVAKEDIVKAWRFGSTWVPMEQDTFEPLDTMKGVEVLGFFPRKAVKRHLLIGEVRFIWPDLANPRAQVAFSSFVEGLALRDMVTVVRWVLKDHADPVIGLCIPEMEYPGEDQRLDYMFWVKLPFAEDEHNFWFPSLTSYKTSTGKVIKEHPLLPTDEQCELMDEFVDAMDLDNLAERERDQAKAEREDDDDMAEDVADEEPAKWFKINQSYNPAIHRIKEAIFHASLTQDLDKEPLGPPHPELIKYFETPAQLAKGVEDVAGRLKDSLSIKKVPPKVKRKRKKADKEALGENEGFIDIDELFAAPEASPSKGKAKEEPISPTRPKAEPVSPQQHRRARKPSRSSSEESDILPPPEKASTAKPKRGRLISNENPLDDFNRQVEETSDFARLIKELGTIVKENVGASFSRQAFPLAIECFKTMRSTAMTYEEVETYNEYLDDLEAHVKEPDFKHKDFWQHVEKAGNEVGKISEEEAAAAIAYDEE